jgi:hypothetical protein
MMDDELDSGAYENEFDDADDDDDERDYIK